MKFVLNTNYVAKPDLNPSCFLFIFYVIPNSVRFLKSQPEHACCIVIVLNNKGYLISHSICEKKNVFALVVTKKSWWPAAAGLDTPRPENAPINHCLKTIFRSVKLPKRNYQQHNMCSQPEISEVIRKKNIKPGKSMKFEILPEFQNIPKSTTMNHPMMSKKIQEKDSSDFFPSSGLCV